MSSLGKGVACASMGALLQGCGYQVRLRKLDPYFNIDPGTMNPYQHGEVFVTEDGQETDLDLGHYERFTNVNTSANSNITSGRIYQEVLEKERRGEYLGKTIQVVPHITEVLKKFIFSGSKKEEINILEIGGTVGDIESQPFLETIRQIGQQLPRKDVLYLHLTYVPYLKAPGELKTKPTQHSVKELRAMGIQPDILLCRCDRRLPSKEREKISLFCQLPKSCVIEAIDTDNIYKVPLLLDEQGLPEQVLSHFELPSKKKNLGKWERIEKALAAQSRSKKKVTIGVIGKYTGLRDSYRSIEEALFHGALHHGVDLTVRLLDSSRLEKSLEPLTSCDGLLIPGGFGTRGLEGKIKTAGYAREQRIPFFGICLGLQVSVISFARDVCSLKGASTMEEAKTPPVDPVICTLHQWLSAGLVEKRSGKESKGGTMRLGCYPCHLKHNSLIQKIYQKKKVLERHRHRYELNGKYKSLFEANGLIASGLSKDNQLIEAMEYTPHPWYIGVQFHPEFASRPFEPHPLFVSFIEATLMKHESSSKG